MEKRGYGQKILNTTIDNNSPKPSEHSKTIKSHIGYKDIDHTLHAFYRLIKISVERAHRLLL